MRYSLTLRILISLGSPIPHGVLMQGLLNMNTRCIDAMNEVAWNILVLRKVLRVLDG